MWALAINEKYPVEISHEKEINELHAKLGHLSEAITWATGKAMDLKSTGLLMKKAKKSGESKVPVDRSKVKGEIFYWYQFPLYSDYVQLSCLLLTEDSTG